MVYPNAAMDKEFAEAFYEATSSGSESIESCLQSRKG